MKHNTGKSAYKYKTHRMAKFWREGGAVHFRFSVVNFHEHKTNVVSCLIALRRLETRDSHYFIIGLLTTWDWFNKGDLSIKVGRGMGGIKTTQDDYD